MFKEEDIKKIVFQVGGKEIQISTGKLARQATSAVELRCNDTVLLITVTKSKTVREGMDYFPLLVDFEEKLYSVGRIPGSYARREGKASDKAVLISRLIDRPIRPLFPDSYRNDLQVNVMTLSVGNDAPPDTLAMLGVGFALEISGLPFEGPLGAVRVALDDAGNFIINPSEEMTNNSKLDIVVAGTKDSIMMVEAGSNFVPDDIVVNAIAHAHEEIKKQVEVIAKFGEICGTTKGEFEAPARSDVLTKIVKEAAHDDLIASMQNANKQKREMYVSAAKDKVEDALANLLADKTVDDPLIQYLDLFPTAIADEIKKYEKDLLRKQILETGIRADSRKADEVRHIFIEVGALPKVHGDGLFIRGDTQVLSILSLGTERLARSLDGIDSETEKYYMHNYNFPAWSVGEVRPNRGPGRREIGHGALAERALIPALPERTEFPYAIRVVSEVLESSGSTSMASTCASSLALMDGGVPIKTAVAGVAMGLIKGDSSFAVLTDIHELEDFLGDMDFKVAGNEHGISALQMDIKIRGISIEIIREAIERAKAGRLHILNEMNKIINKPNPELKPSAPRVTCTQIDQEKIGAVIGPSGKNIKWIIEQSGAEININDDGLVCIYSVTKESGEIAKKLVIAMAEGVQVGDVWEAKIVKILEGVGAIAEIFAGQSGLIHISQISHNKVTDIGAFLELGQVVKVKVNSVDPFKGRISLSMKDLSNSNGSDAGASQNKREKAANVT